MTIKELRRRKKISQTKLGQLLGVHLRTIQNWESGKTPIPDKRLSKLAEVLDFNIHDLVALKFGFKNKNLIDFNSKISKKNQNVGLISVLNEINTNLKEIIVLLRS